MAVIDAAGSRLAAATTSRLRRGLGLIDLVRLVLQQSVDVLTQALAYLVVDLLGALGEQFVALLTLQAAQLAVSFQGGSDLGVNAVAQLAVDGALAGAGKEQAVTSWVGRLISRISLTHEQSPLCSG